MFLIVENHQIPALNVTSSPVPKLTVTADPTFTLSSSTTIPVPAAVTLSSAEPSIAGNVPVSCPAGRLVRFAPDPENEVAVMIPVVLILIVPDTALDIPAVVAYPAVPYVVDTPAVVA